MESWMKFSITRSSSGAWRGSVLSWGLGLKCKIQLGSSSYLNYIRQALWSHFMFDLLTFRTSLQILELFQKQLQNEAPEMFVFGLQTFTRPSIGTGWKHDDRICIFGWSVHLSVMSIVMRSFQNMKHISMWWFLFNCFCITNVLPSLGME